MCTKVQGTGIRFKKVILKGFLRLSIQPVQLGGGAATRARRARKKPTSPPTLFYLLLDAHPVINLVHTSTCGYLRLCTVYNCTAVRHGETYWRINLLQLRMSVHSTTPVHVQLYAARMRV